MSIAGFPQKLEDKELTQHPIEDMQVLCIYTVSSNLEFTLQLSFDGVRNTYVYHYMHGWI